MKALVTGARGFVGTHLTASLREAGWTVVTMDRRGPADVVGDLLRVPLRGLKADVAFHLAGFASPAASAEASLETWDANAAATARFLRESSAGRYVVASSGHVYAPAARPIAEDGRLDPASPYAASKLCAEALARASGKDVVLLRPFNHTGPGQSADYFCPRVARAIADHERGRGPRTLELGPLDARRDFFDVRDMVRAYRLAAERAPSGSVYNIGTGEPVELRRVVKILMATAKCSLWFRGNGSDPSTLSGDASAFRAATGWRPEIPLRQTLTDLLEHERGVSAAATR